MPKVPYESLVFRANLFIQKMTLANDLLTINYWWNVYVSLLENSGWTILEFEKEELKRIDQSWTEKNILN